jgi:hypothetical protein
MISYRFRPRWLDASSVTWLGHRSNGLFDSVIVPRGPSHRATAHRARAWSLLLFTIRFRLSILRMGSLILPVHSFGLGNMLWELELILHHVNLLLRHSNIAQPANAKQSKIRIGKRHATQTRLFCYTDLSSRLLKPCGW